jgi:heterotetrameric sarcosine oxidase delta subunit
MFLLECPNCGKRNVAEFRWGGEARPRPKDGENLPPEEWQQFLYMRANKRGLQREWWYHRAGCQKWFLALRDTNSHEVHATFFYGEDQQAPVVDDLKSPLA